MKSTFEVGAEVEGYAELATYYGCITIYLIVCILIL